MIRDHYIILSAMVSFIKKLNSSKPSILLIGNHFSDRAYNQNAWQSLATELRSAGYCVRTCSGKRNKVLRLAEMLSTIWIQRDNYEIAQIDVFSGPAFLWAYLSAKLLYRLKKPYILTLRGGNLPNYAHERPKQVRWLLNNAKAISSPSRYLQDAMQPYGQNIQVIPNALEISHYGYLQRTKVEPKLIWLRAFHEIYNPEMAIDVLDRLKKDYPSVHLTMVGPDKGDGSLVRTKKLSESLGLNQIVEFPGKVDKADVPLWLNKGDIFINTTRVDNTPISVMEAMACGLCIVSTNVGGVPYLLENEQDALLVPPNDPEAMAAAIHHILTEPDLAERLSCNARSKAEQFDWSIVLPQWENLFFIS